MSISPFLLWRHTCATSYRRNCCEWTLQNSKIVYLIDSYTDSKNYTCISKKKNNRFEMFVVMIYKGIEYWGKLILYNTCSEGRAAKQVNKKAFIYHTVAVVISPPEKLLQNRVLVHFRLQKNKLRLNKKQKKQKKIKQKKKNHRIKYD